MQLTEAASLPCIIVKTKKMLFSAPGGWQHPQLQQHTAVCLPNATLGCAPGSHAPHGQRRLEPLLSEHPTNFWPRSCDNVHYRWQQAALRCSTARPPAHTAAPPAPPAPAPHLPALFMGSPAARLHSTDRHRPRARRTAHLPPTATTSSRRQDEAVRRGGRRLYSGGGAAAEPSRSEPNRSAPCRPRPATPPRGLPAGLRVPPRIRFSRGRSRLT